jgi:hypothetical protein
MDVREIVCECMDWINMAQESDKLEFDGNKSIIDCGLEKISGTAWLADRQAGCEG